VDRARHPLPAEAAVPGLKQLTDITGGDDRSGPDVSRLRQIVPPPGPKWEPARRGMRCPISPRPPAQGLGADHASRVETSRSESFWSSSSVSRYFGSAPFSCAQNGSASNPIGPYRSACAIALPETSSSATRIRHAARRPLTARLPVIVTDRYSNSRRGPAGNTNTCPVCPVGGLASPGGSARQNVRSCRGMRLAQVRRSRG
jgi:hypothetical protein